MGDRHVFINQVHGNLQQLILQVNNISGTSPSISHIRDQIKESTEELKTALADANNIKLSHLKELHQTISSTPQAISKLASGDVPSTLSGVLDIAESFAPILGSLAGPEGGLAGAAVAAVLSIFNGIFGLSGKKGPSLGDIVQHVIGSSLRKERDRNIRDKAFGIRDLFLTSRAFLDGARENRKTLGEREIDSIVNKVPIGNGVTFLGILESEIQSLANQDNDNRKPEDVLSDCGACVRYTSLYYQLVLLQDHVLTELYTMIRASQTCDHLASGVLNVKRERERTARATLEFLHGGCNPVIATLNIAENDDGKKAFMKWLGISPEYTSDLSHLCGSRIVLRSDNIPSKRLYLSYGNDVKALDYRCVDEQGEFKLARSGVFWTFESQYWPHYYLSIGQTMAVTSRNGQNEFTDFIVMRNGSTGKYLITPRLRPDLFLCLCRDHTVHLKSARILADCQFELCSPYNAS